jgi:hypothetical protein
VTSQTIAIVEDLLDKLQKLLPEKQQEVLAFVEFLLFQQTRSIQQQEQQHALGYDRKPVLPGEFDVWEDEQIWGEEVE